MGSTISANQKCSEDNVSSSLEGYSNNRPRRFSLRKVSYADVVNITRKSSNESNRCNLQKPLCRSSRRRRRESSLSDIGVVSKTVWPVKVCESMFLPEFKIKDSVNINQFKVQEELGRGAFSTVYRVRLSSLDEEYALKVLSKAKLIEEDSVVQVKEEVLIQSSCGHHTFIASCVDYWQSRHLLFIMSEYLSGGELWHLLQRYQLLPEDLARIYIAEIALALDFLHNAGVIYRDMKLENIVLDTCGHLRLVDFGLSKRLRYGARTSTLCGTIQFIAPEVFEGSYGHAADWWSLGVVACLLLTGQTR